MTSKLSLIYMSLSAVILVAALAVQTEQGVGKPSITGLSEKGLRSVMTAIQVH